jgi:hypothetical protein
VIQIVNGFRVVANGGRAPRMRIPPAGTRSWIGSGVQVTSPANNLMRITYPNLATYEHQYPDQDSFERDIQILLLGGDPSFNGFYAGEYYNGIVRYLRTWTRIN